MRLYQLPQAECCARRGEADETPTKARERAMAGRRAGESRSNKKAEVIALLKRPQGVTLAEIVKTTDWRSNTVEIFESCRR